MNYLAVLVQLMMIIFLMKQTEKVFVYSIQQRKDDGDSSRK